jgi:hypothetical protein
MKKLIIGALALIGGVALAGVLHERYVANPQP